MRTPYGTASLGEKTAQRGDLVASILLENIRKAYGTTEVVKGLDLEIADGEFVVLVGPSGCGKSTTLRMIAGLESITSGELSIDSRVVNDVGPGDRDLAMVFQSYALYPHMTVAENIGYGLRVRKTPKAEVQAKVSEVAQMLGLEDYLDRKPAQLSGGQRQRVAMARAIVRRPAAFLFDEPLSNLDAKLRTEVRAEIAKLRRALGTTTVYVTHDQVEAMTLADRVVVLHEGVAQQIGPPLEVYGAPANRFVAGFLGTPTMNFFERAAFDAGRFVPDGDGLLAFVAPEQTHSVGARPHDLIAEKKNATTDRGSQWIPLGALTVDVVEHLGPESFAFGMVGNHRICAHVDDVTITHGDEVALFIDKAHLHFFDNDGTRIEGAS